VAPSEGFFQSDDTGTLTIKVRMWIQLINVWCIRGECVSARHRKEEQHRSAFPGKAEALAMEDLSNELELAFGHVSSADGIADETIDPVCGKTVAKAATVYEYEYQDCRYYFCSASCQFAFCSDPAGYAPL
jgi:YHS domain-containing protein